jgi:hypothetical protein
LPSATTPRAPTVNGSKPCLPLSSLSRQQHETELAALLHRGEHVAHAQQHLRQLITDLIAAGAREGDLRNDVPPAELATYCLYALTAAGSLSSQAAVHRLISVTLTGLRAASSTTAPAPSR